MQLFAVMEKHLLREKVLNILYYHPTKLQAFREKIHDALNAKQIIGKDLETILKQEGVQRDDLDVEHDEADIDWTEIRDC